MGKPWALGRLCALCAGTGPGSLCHPHGSVLPRDAAAAVPCQHHWLGPGCCLEGRKVVLLFPSAACVWSWPPQGSLAFPRASRSCLGLLCHLLPPFHLVRRFPCTSILSGMGSHCRCCSEGEEHTHPSLLSTCSWMDRLCQCLWMGGTGEPLRVGRCCCSHGETSAKGDRLLKQGCSDQSSLTTGLSC